MKTILVPSDFSSDAENALEYATNFSKKVKANILIYHSYFIPVPATDIPFLVPDVDLKKSALSTLTKLKNKYATAYPEINFDISVSEGYVVDEIIEQEKKAKCELVVMGTRGASGISETLIGSVAAAVAGNSICPLLIVPKNAKLNGINKIVFAANYGSEDFKNLYELIDIARKFDSEIILLHINSEEYDKTFEFAELEGFKTQIINESGYSKISIKLLDDKDTYHGLNFYLEEIKADILAINMRNRTFAQKLFSRSLTKRMAYHSHIPVLVFHTSV